MCNSHIHNMNVHPTAEDRQVYKMQAQVEKGDEDNRTRLMQVSNT